MIFFIINIHKEEHCISKGQWIKTGKELGT